ncbi:hypothetical protein L9F63_001005, partial [Diploptera punctata]
FVLKLFIIGPFANMKTNVANILLRHSCLLTTFYASSENLFRIVCGISIITYEMKYTAIKGCKTFTCSMKIQRYSVCLETQNDIQGGRDNHCPFTQHAACRGFRSLQNSIPAQDKLDCFMEAYDIGLDQSVKLLSRSSSCCQPCSQMLNTLAHLLLRASAFESIHIFDPYRVNDAIKETRVNQTICPTHQQPLYISCLPCSAGRKTKPVQGKYTISMLFTCDISFKKIYGFRQTDSNAFSVNH